MSIENGVRTVGGDVLIVRGVEDTDGLQMLGLPIAEAYQRAHTVVLVPDAAPARVIKTPTERRGETIAFVDADTRLGRVVMGLNRIYSAYQSEHRGDGHVAHAIVGLFLFYWIDDVRQERPIDLIQSDFDAFERAVERFIASDFGSNVRRGTVSVHDDNIGA